MAEHFSSRSSSNWIFSIQVVILLIAVLSMAFVLNLLLPAIAEFIVTEVPLLWTSMNSWFTPPYLYIVINGIIITIAASSRFHHQTKIDDDQMMELVSTTDHHHLVKIQQSDSNPEFESIKSDYDHDDGYFVKNQVVTTPDLENFEPEEYGNTTEGDFSVVMKTILISATGKEEGREKDDLVDSRSMLALNRTDSAEIPLEYSFSEEKPPVSARIGNRKTVKGSNEGGFKVLRSVAKPKRNETLESTWKTITEGRPIPLARHLKKSDTWETQNTGPHSSSSGLKMMKKSETLNDDKNSNQSSSLRGSVKLRREPSPSQDELNRRVEAFINKFNEEMRLQRQESLNQYKEKVTGWGHH